MASNFDALRLAGLLEHEASEHGKADYKHKAAAELRRLHSRLEADEALMRQAAKVIGDASWYIPDGCPLDLEAEGTVIALRTRLEETPLPHAVGKP